jgi:hypothetical protein
MTYEQTYNVIVSGTVSTNTTTYTTTSANQTFSGNVDLATLAPEIKVADFVSGIIKEFNLTCFGTSVNNFTLQPLDEWYNSGAIIDITKYTDIDSIDVDRIKLYKKISFKYLESESFMNKNFKSLYFRDYGNTNSSFDYDGGEYSVEVPFENLMFQKFTGTELQVGYHLNETFQSYVPKPTLLYMYDQKPCSFKFWNGTTHVTVTEYMPFGQDTIIQGVNHSLNFSADQSTLLNVPISNSLFAEYYSPCECIAIPNISIRNMRLVLCALIIYVCCYYDVCRVVRVMRMLILITSNRFDEYIEVWNCRYSKSLSSFN